MGVVVRLHQNAKQCEERPENIYNLCAFVCVCGLGQSAAATQSDRWCRHSRQIASSSLADRRDLDFTRFHLASFGFGSAACATALQW